MSWEASVAEEAAAESSTGLVRRMEMVCEARRLHLWMFRKGLSTKTRTWLAGKITELLEVAERDAAGSEEVRKLFRELRTDAQSRLSPEMVTRDAQAVCRHYDRLAALV